ncbi:MAG: hypothetical protein IPJ26_03980 [Bacteroidetes bacterium]|nr:hypothetical protein [Bacteroidota bacterium]
MNIINGVKEGVYREFDKEGNITISKLYEKDKVYAEGGTVDAQGDNKESGSIFIKMEIRSGKEVLKMD